MKISFEELKEATKDIVKLIQEKGHPHMTIIIQQDHVELLEGSVCIPLEIKD